MIADHRGRGRTEQDRTSGHLRPQHGQIAAIVAQAVLLLVGRFVFLVDNDDAEMLQRRKDRRPRSQHHFGRGRKNRLPLVETLAVTETAVQHRQLRPESGIKMGLELGGQGDFRHQHQRRFCLGSRACCTAWR